MSFRVQFRRGTEANWDSANPVLLTGEIGYATNNNRFKIGDGSRPWRSLPYVATGGAGTVVSVIAGVGLIGGTITTTGTIAVDKSVVMTLNTPQVILNKTLKAPAELLTRINHSGGELRLDVRQSNDFYIDLSGNISNFIFDNLDHPGKLFSFRLMIKSNGIYLISWPPNCYWPNGQTPILSGSGKLDIINIITYDNGVTFYGKVEAKNISA